ncbi:hypothetical protein DW66_2561 [Pseudomonas putida]|nr:hypothetical protein DW66_2561 [Pseudomonas putida]
MLDPSWRTHIIGGFFEDRCLRHKTAPFCEKRNEIAVDFIDIWMLGPRLQN